MCVKVTNKVAALAVDTTKGFNETNCNAKFVENRAWLCKNSYTTAAHGYNSLDDVCTFDSCNSVSGSDVSPHHNLTYTPQTWAHSQAKCSTYTPSLYRCEHGGLGNCDASDCFHKNTTGKKNLTWTDQTGNMRTRCGTECGLTFTAVTTGKDAGVHNVSSVAAADDHSNWNQQTQCVPPTNANDQCQWLGKGCTWAMCSKTGNTEGAGYSNFAAKSLSTVNSDWATAHSTAAELADVTHAEWSDHWWNVRCNWTTEWDHQVSEVTTIADWDKYVANNTSQHASYKAKVATDSATAATKAEKAALNGNTTNMDKYAYFVSQDTSYTPSASNPYPAEADWNKWHAASLKAATTKAEVDALRADDETRLTDAKAWQKANCADATGKKVPADQALCTASNDRVDQVNNWIDLDDAALLKLAKAYHAPAEAKTATYKSVEA